MEFNGKFVAAGFDEKIHATHKCFDDLASIGSVAFKFLFDVAAIPQQTGEAIARDGFGPKNFRQLAFTHASPQVELPKSILSRDETLSEEQILLCPGVNVRDTPRIAEHSDGPLESGHGDWPRGLGQDSLGTRFESLRGLSKAAAGNSQERADY